jgi:hypothetical protein
MKSRDEALDGTWGEALGGTWGEMLGGALCRALDEVSMGIFIFVLLLIFVTRPRGNTISFLSRKREGEGEMGRRARKFAGRKDGDDLMMSGC